MDRSVERGYAGQFADRDRVGEDCLLWFHHLPWSWELDNGDTLWDALVRRYDLGVTQVEEMQRRWSVLESHVDPERFAKTAQLLEVQLREAR
ncbi:MAG TPA: hypothetical protein VIV64_01360 [Gammaproteobacteria bacterium]